MRNILPGLLLLAVLFSSCDNKGDQQSTEATTTTTEAPATPKNPESSLGDKPTSALMNVLSSYYSLKDALVATDAKKSDPAATSLIAAAEIFRDEIANMPQYTGMESQIKDIINASDSMVGAKAADIEVKRAHFSTVSTAMYKLVKDANLKNAGVYQQYCPMAFNDKGAYWLAAETDIKNPYYGKKMLECGEVRDSL